MAATTVRSSRRYRARVAPRTSSRGGGSRIQWERLARIALVLIVFAVLASYVKPVISLIDTWKQERAAKQQLVELQAENAKLQHRADQLKTPAAALREARRLGMVAPGEQAYKITGLK